MSTLAGIRTKVISKVKDDSGKLVNPGDYDRNIGEAIKEYSRHRPATSAVDITGDGTNDYALPSGWIEDFSSIKNIEYPVDDVPATLLDAEDYEIYQTPTAKKIRLRENKPAATETFRVTFAILRTDATIPAVDEDALANLAGALCLQELANAFAQTSDSTIAADAVQYASKAREFKDRARELERLYKAHLGLKADDTTPAASAVTDLEMNYPGGGDRLTHPRWGRRAR